MPEDSFYCMNAFPEQDIEFEAIKRKINMLTGTWRNIWLTVGIVESN